MMKYKYPPLYKYLAYLLITYMFLRHQKVLPIDKLFANSLVFTIVLITLDYLFINNHPLPTDIKHKDEEVNVDDIDIDIDDDEHDENDENEENEDYDEEYIATTRRRRKSKQMNEEERERYNEARYVEHYDLANNRYNDTSYDNQYGNNTLMPYNA